MATLFEIVYTLGSWIFFGVLLCAVAWLIVQLFATIFKLIVKYPCMFLVYQLKRIPYVGNWIGNCVVIVLTGALLVFILFCIHIPYLFIALKSLMGRE